MAYTSPPPCRSQCAQCQHRSAQAPVIILILSDTLFNKTSSSNNCLAFVPTCAPPPSAPRSCNASTPSMANTPQCLPTTHFKPAPSWYAFFFLSSSSSSLLCALANPLMSPPRCSDSFSLPFVLCSSPWVCFLHVVARFSLTSLSVLKRW